MRAHILSRDDRTHMKHIIWFIWYEAQEFYFEMPKLNRDYFRYWIGKMGDMQLKPLKAVAPAPEKRQNDLKQKTFRFLFRVRQLCDVMK